MIDVTLRIQRFNPEADQKSHWQDYSVRAAPEDRVLDALFYVKERIDGTLTYRRSCAHGVCGSDAMMINGKNQLACKVLVKNCVPEAAPRPLIAIAPLKGFPIIKDLVVDMDGFFKKFRKVKPYLITQTKPPQNAERRQSPNEREVFDDTTKCILCAACTTACPTFWLNEDYLGPQAIVAGHRFLFDSRDEARTERLTQLGGEDAALTCRTFANCLEACPRDINIVKAIAQVRQLLVKSLKGRHENQTPEDS